MFLKSISHVRITISFETIHLPANLNSLINDYSFVEKIPGPTQLLKTLRLSMFEKRIEKIVEKLGENRK